MTTKYTSIGIDKETKLNFDMALVTYSLKIGRKVSPSEFLEHLIMQKEAEQLTEVYL